MRTPATPFRRVRRPLLFLIFCWLLSDTILQTIFFTSLDPQVITSCCAVVFDPTGSFSDNPAGLFARFPTADLFFSIAALYLCTGFLPWPLGKRIFRLLYGLGAPVFFFFGLAALTSCISPYIYALPHHHCPFCILQKEYHFAGYFLYGFLLAGAVTGAGTVLIGMFRKKDSLKKAIPRVQRRLCWISMLSYGSFVFWVTYPVVFSDFRITGY